MAAHLVIALQSPTTYGMDLFACSECGAVVVNGLSPDALWQCDHGPYGEKRRRPIARELLEEILERVKRLEARG